MSASGFTVELEGFRGPLELLLDLIEQQKLRVNDVSLANVADTYIQYVQDRSQIPLSETAHFTVIASTLLLIKSRSLLPELELTEEEEEDVRELEHRLALYAIIRSAARTFFRQWGNRSLLPAHAPARTITFTPAPNISTAELHQHACSLVSRLATARQGLTTQKPTAYVEPEIRLEDVVQKITSHIRATYQDSFRNITSSVNRVDAIVHFLALLELVKQGGLSARQKDHFGDIMLQHDVVTTPHYGS